MPAESGKRFKPSKYVPVSAAGIFLVGATTLFFAFTCPGLSLSVSPAVPIYNAVVFLFVLANFSMATFMDPGIFPRAEEDEDKEDDFRAPLYKTVEIKGIQVRMKWCATCRFYRPPRCSHCSVCDNCVEEFDHHCPWVNNCIGRRNYRYFFLFLLSLTAHIVGVFGFGLLYVLYHVEELSGVRTAVTMAVMCVAGLFFIPVAGLTGFHVVLVARGRTTNEQVTGKFRGGVNPFTNGCCNNVSRVLCSSPAPRYLGRPKKEQTVVVRPPFLRPEVSDGQIAVKIMDNGIQGELKRSKSKGSLDVTESQSADAEPPPPPKPDLSRYAGLRTHLSLAAAEESSLLGKDSPPTPTMYKYRPGYSSSSASAALPHSTSAKLSRGDSLKEPTSVADGGRHPSYRSEPSLEPDGFRSPTFGKGFHVDPLSSGSRSSSLKSAQGTGFELGQLQSIRSEGTTSTSYKSLANQTRNGSLSYDSLLTPSDSPDPEAGPAGPEPEPEPPLGYTSPFLSARLAQQREAERRLGPAGPRDPSPVRYDNLSRHIVASLQERERLLLRRSPPPPGRDEEPAPADSGVRSTPGSGHAPRTSSSSDDPKRSPLGKTPLGRPGVPRFGKPEGLRGRGLGSPEPSPAAPFLGRSASHGGPKAPPGGPETEEVALQPLLAPKDELQLKTAYSKSNGQPKSLGPGSPGPGQQTLGSPTRGGVKKVSGVGGTTYEISV
ncbi:palmitoyltransferase ZDHHC5 [Ornithorhynchus anatinus]|uniref:Palmitoyltransferase n=1 Tax=Ornithorhynchus anatinus TaxID=9258 RepID=A0A6I8P807_ORNAN|nr:palmitoyltransferase ZDHHC5 [Ornithorhynchus anatinus]